MKEYKVILHSGKTVEISEDELREIFLEFKNNINVYLNEKKNELTEDEYRELLIKINSMIE